MKKFDMSDFGLVIFGLVLTLSLTSCATKLTPENKISFWKLHSRCDIEMQSVLNTNDAEFTVEFCKNYLARIAPSQDVLNDIGGDAYMEKLTDIYRDKIIIANTLNRGKHAEIYKLPLQYSTDTATEIDEVFDQTKNIMYERYITDRVNREVANVKTDK